MAKLGPFSFFSRQPNAAPQQQLQQQKKKSGEPAPNTPGGVQKRLVVKNGQVSDAEFAPIDEDDVDTGSGNGGEFQKRFGQQGFGGNNPAMQGNAHIMNRALLAQQLGDPGSLDPDTLGDPPSPDARRWLKNHGMVLLLPENWRYMGQQLDGKSMSFNSTGTTEGHGVEVSTWRLPADVPLEKIVAGYLEEAEEGKRLGRLLSFEPKNMGETNGILLVGWGPEKPEDLAKIDEEQVFLATDGTGQRKMSWRGTVERRGEHQLVIVSFTSPFETFLDAKAVYDAILAKGDVTSG